MKRILAILLAAMMLFSLVACDTGDNPDNPNKDSPGTSQNDNQGDTQGGTENQGGENQNVKIDLIDIPNSAILAYKNGKTELQGDEATVMISKVPTEIRKGVGEIVENKCTLKTNAGGTQYVFDVHFSVPNTSVASAYKALCDYYKTLDGSVKSEEASALGMTFSWGEMYRCFYTESYYDPNTGGIVVGFYINVTAEDDVAAANASLVAAGFGGFTFPTDLTDSDVTLYDNEGAKVTYVSVANEKYTEILQNLFGTTGMTAKHTSTGATISSLDEVKSSDTKGNYIKHSFVLTNGTAEFQIFVTYYENEYKDLMYSKTYAAQTLEISVRKL